MHNLRIPVLYTDSQVKVYSSISHQCLYELHLAMIAKAEAKERTLENPISILDIRKATEYKHFNIEELQQTLIEISKIPVDKVTQFKDIGITKKLFSRNEK